MKYWEHKEITQEKFNKLIDEMGVFYAFSVKQFKEKKREGVKYYDIGAGMFCPQENFEELERRWEELIENSTKEALENCEVIDIIVYELANHEYCITYDLTDTREALSEFNFSNEQYKEAIKKYLKDIDS